MPRCPLDLFIGLEQGLDEHLAVPPVLELVAECELDERIVGASVIVEVLFRWYVYAEMMCGISTR
jgi:hypothetical protein